MSDQKSEKRKESSDHLLIKFIGLLILILLFTWMVLKLTGR